MSEMFNWVNYWGFLSSKNLTAHFIHGTQKWYGPRFVSTTQMSVQVVHKEEPEGSEQS